MAVGSQSEGSGGIECEWAASCDPQPNRRDLAPDRAENVRRARQRGPARWTAFGWSATHSTVTSVGDAPCITHDLIGQHSCGRPQVDFKAVLLIRSTSPDTATPPGAVQIRLRCL